MPSDLDSRKNTRIDAFKKDKASKWTIGSWIGAGVSLLFGFLMLPIGGVAYKNGFDYEREEVELDGTNRKNRHTKSPIIKATAGVTVAGAVIGGIIVGALLGVGVSFLFPLAIPFMVAAVATGVAMGAVGGLLAATPTLILAKAGREYGKSDARKEVSIALIKQDEKSLGRNYTSKEWKSALNDSRSKGGERTRY